jgi:surface polysaccharide O-acyltransferase-like enzyme
LQSRADYLTYIHRFRGIAILYIILGHCTAVLAWQGTPVERVLTIILCNGTVLFVFIAGYLFQHLSRRFHYGHYLKTKCLHVVLPYLIWSVPAIVYFTCMAHRGGVAPSFYEQSIPVQVATFLLTGFHVVPYWFIPMICVFYLVAPLLLALDRTPKMYLLLPLLIVLSCFVPRWEGLLHDFVHFLSVYMLGMFFSRYRREIAERFHSGGWVLGLLLAAVGLAAAQYGFTTGTMGWLNLLQKLCLCVALVLWLPRYHLVPMRTLECVAGLSFALYFAHAYVMMLFQRLLGFIQGASHQLDGSLLLFVVFCALFVPVCVALVAMARRLLGRYSRSVIGS